MPAKAPREAGGSLQPICPLPDNPHYFMYGGSPILLVTCDQHYGAVINADFDYAAFLDTIAAVGMNFTRLYPGAYIERDGEYMPDNNLGARNGRQVLPWPRTKESGAHEVLGGFKLDLDRWNDAYFERLHGFIGAARDRGIIVDIAFFNGMYKERWSFQPLFHANNVQGVGTCEAVHVQTLLDAALADYHEAYVRKITAEVAGYENVLLDICDEPHVGGCPPALYKPWLSRLIDAVMDEERPLPRRHVIVQTIEPYTAAVPKDSPGDFSADPRVSATAHEYAWGIRHLDTEYEHGKPMILIETNYYPDQYAGSRIDAARVEAWEFIVGGGAAFMQLNGLYSTFNAAGSGTEIGCLLDQMKVLKDFMARFDLAKMRQDTTLVAGGVPAGAFLRAISDPGRRWALYLHHSRYAGWMIAEIGQGSCYQPLAGSHTATLQMRLPPGRYRAEWVEPRTGRTIRIETLEHAAPGAGMLALTTPEHGTDIALDLSRAT